MSIKKRVNNNHTAIEKLANELSDKPYGEQKVDNKLIPTTITLTPKLLFYLEDVAKYNKRNKKQPRSVSALIRDCIEKTFRIE